MGATSPFSKSYLPTSGMSLSLINVKNVSLEMFLV